MKSAVIRYSLFNDNQNSQRSCRRDEWEIINRKSGFRPSNRNEIGETPCALGSGIVNFKDFLYIKQMLKWANDKLMERFIV